MNPRKKQFLAAVLGSDGAQALIKAAERSQNLENVLVPRTIMAWLQVAKRSDYEGSIPGVDSSYLEFKKSENDTFSGSISVGEGVYPFANASLVGVAAWIAVSIGTDNEHVSDTLKSIDLVKLGKSIDLLVKARIVVEGLSKVEPPGLPHAPTQPIQHEAPTLPTATQASKGPTVGKKPRKPKVELDTDPKTPMSPVATQIAQQSGQAAKPAGQAVKPKLPGALKTPSVKVTKAQSDRPCPACTIRQFRADVFRGCMCFRELAKNVKATKLEDGYQLEFAASMDREEILTLLESMGIG